MSDQFQKTIIIIGAGPSGLSAARRLLQSGYKNVTIIEATNRIGGRVSTSDFGNGWVEIGAQWIHGQENNTVYKTALQHNLLNEEPYELFKNQVYTEDGSEIDKSLVEEVVNTLDDCIMRASLKNQTEFPQTMTIDELLNKEMEKLIKKSSPSAAVESKMNAMLRWFKTRQSSGDGSDSLTQLSVKSNSVYRECEGSQSINFKNGYRSLIKVLASDIPSSIISFNKSVQEINLLPNGKGVHITSCDSTVNYADHVIVTVSLGYLKEYAQKLFKPALPPAKLQTIEKLGFGTVNKIFLEFDSSFWPANSTGYSLAWKDAEKFDHPDHKWGTSIFGFFTVPFASNVLCGWMSGPGARYMETLSDDEVKATSLYLLKRFSGIKNLPSVKSFKRSRWSSQPFTRGSYSYLNSQQTSNKELATPINAQCGETQIPTILFAGEATHPYYYSTVHGAIDSGVREADRIIQLYSSKDASKSKL